MAPLPGADGDNLARGKIIDETKWCVYCCCGGWGLGPFNDPLVGGEGKQLCIRGSCTTTDLWGTDGLCGVVRVCICFVEQCQFPPLADEKICACCNVKCGPEIGSTLWNHEIFDRTDLMDGTFWCQYFVCGGVGFTPPLKNGLWAEAFKFLICRGSGNIEPPIIDGVMCSEVSTFCCIWRECQFPPAHPNPKIAICTWRMNKEAHQAPAQCEMS